MTHPLQPLPDHHILRTSEVAAAFGCGVGTIERVLKQGRFPGAFRTPGMGKGPGRWRIPREAAVKVGRGMGVLDQ